MQPVFPGNGQAKPQLVDGYGRPFEKHYDDVPVPHVLTFASLVTGANRTYLHGRFDEAVRFSRADAVGMRRDAGIMGIVNERKLAVSSLKWHLEIPDEKDARQVEVRDTLTQVLKYTPGLGRMIWALLDALWYGRYAVQVRWWFRPWMGKKVFAPKWWGPVNGDKIGYRFDGTPYVLVNGGDATNGIAHGEFINSTLGRAVLLTPELREYFVIHTHEVDDADYFEGEKGDRVHGVGIRDGIWWLDYIRREILDWVLKYIERFGLGVNIWTFEAGNPTSLRQVSEAAAAVDKNVNILVPGYPDGKGGLKGPLERLEQSMAGVDALVKLVESWFEDKIERYIIGQKLSSGTEGSGLGGNGVANLHSQTKHKIAAMDALNLQESLTGTEECPGLISTMVKWTYPWADFPVRFVFDVDTPESAERLNAAHSVVEFGLDVKEDDVYAAAGFSKPAKGDKVIKGQQPQQPGMPGAGGQQRMLPGMEDAEGDDGASLEPGSLGAFVRDNYDRAGGGGEESGGASAASGNWQHVVSKNGREYWKNPQTGQRRYQETRPGSVRGSAL